MLQVKMKVRILKTLITPNRVLLPGSVVEVDKKTAKDWIKARVAEEDKAIDRSPEVKDVFKTKRTSRK